MTALIDRFLRMLGYVPLVEVALADEFELELHLVTVTAEQRQELRRVAISAGQLGFATADEATAAMHRGMTVTNTRISDLIWAQSHGANPEAVSRRIDEIWSEHP